MSSKDSTSASKFGVTETKRSMHPELVTKEPGHCPQCGMKLLPAQLVAQAGAGHEQEGHEHGEHEEHAGHGGHDHAAHGGIEWEDDMVEVNRLTTPANMR